VSILWLWDGFIHFFIARLALQTSRWLKHCAVTVSHTNKLEAVVRILMVGMLLWYDSSLSSPEFLSLLKTATVSDRRLKNRKEKDLVQKTWA